MRRKSLDRWMMTSNAWSPADSLCDCARCDQQTRAERERQIERDRASFELLRPGAKRGEKKGSDERKEC